MTLSPNDASAARSAAPGSLPAAVLWDMDGTLVDTEPYWIAAEHELVAAHGGTWTHEDAMALVGNPLLTSAQILRDRGGVDLPVEEIVRFLLGRVIDQVRVKVPWQPGARALLTALREAGVPCALVTMSYRELAEPVVELAPSDAFQVLVCGDEVEHGKPDPEPYLTAAERLGVDITRCVALEDSPAGIASARAAGAATVGVEAVVPVEPAPGLSRTPSLELVDLDLLARVVGGDPVDLMARDVTSVAP
ncbi:HAD family phosphatase [Cellulosimicrobium sp. CUA-896]|uniref:HAD family hydrolase n=1 Tax=Cellulosimicrobium sp. CUA-896 TaxID=1517881 RepID=UPI000960AC4E|nr:HAD family phosphatase [Cellulosimicrobium sp. CUA-896]OLT55209.1 hydrolase [Cellulosimicrobium sp. CUA-896]